MKKFNGKVSQKYWKLWLSEKFFVIKSLDDCNLLNKRSGLPSNCRHQHKCLLCSVKRNDSMDWCLYLYFVFIFNIFLLFIFRQNPENVCIILVYNVWSLNINSLFFTMTITFNLLNWLFTGDKGNPIHDFIIFPTYCSNVQGHISNNISWSTFLSVHFYHILQWSIFHLVCSDRSCCSNSHCAQGPQQNWPCKINVHDNVTIGGQHRMKFAY